MKTCYDILGVSRTADEASIKSAYRQAVLRLHPDRNQSPDASVRFKELQEAYEVISDPMRRARYDQQLSRGIHAPQLSKRKTNPTYPRSRAYTYIRILTDVRALTLEETVTVRAQFAMQGRHHLIENLHGFQVLEGPLYRKGPFESEDGRRIDMEIMYRLKPIQAGYVHLGPATLIANDRKWESAHDTLRVYEEFPAPVRQLAGITHFLVNYGGYVMISLFIGLISYNIINYGFMPDEFFIDGTAKGDYRLATEPADAPATGQPVYEYLFGEGIFDPSVHNSLFIRNGPDFDAVVCVKNVATDQVVRNIYLHRNDYFEMRHIPVGVYQLWVILGRQWDPEKVIEPTGYRGGFNKAQHFLVFDKPGQLMVMDKVKEEEQFNYSRYEVSLFKSPGGNAKASDGDPSGLFRKTIIPKP